MTRRRRGGVKRGDNNLARNQFPKCSPQSGTPREIQNYTEQRTGRREIEVTRRRRGGVKRGKSNLDSNQFPECSPQPGTPREIHRVKERREGGEWRE